MIAQKARIFLKLMTTLGQYMPLPNNFSKEKSKSKTTFQKTFVLGQKLYAQIYLVCVGILIASDLKIYGGVNTLKAHFRNF